MHSHDAMAVVVRPSTRKRSAIRTQLRLRTTKRNPLTTTRSGTHICNLNKTTKSRLCRLLPCHGSPGSFLSPSGCLSHSAQRRTHSQRSRRTVLCQQACGRHTFRDNQFGSHRPCDKARKREWKLLEFLVRQRDTSTSGWREWDILATTGMS